MLEEQNSTRRFSEKEIAHYIREFEPESWFQSKPKLLLVEGDEVQRTFLSMKLKKSGYTVLEARNGQDALKMFEKDHSIRLIATDLGMTEGDGIELIGRVRSTEYRHTYILVFSGHLERDRQLESMRQGADDFVSKPIFFEELLLRLQNGQKMLRLEIQDELIFALAKFCEFKSAETGFHLNRVRAYTQAMCQAFTEHHPELDLSPHSSAWIGRASILHDIGKIAVADEVLHRAGPLKAEEYESVKEHCVVGGSLLGELAEKSCLPYLKTASDIAWYHHERYDGTGYPKGLKGREIPLAARIVAIADVYDALTSARYYKEATPHEVAIETIKEGRGTEFDPDLIDLFLAKSELWDNIRASYHDQEKRK